MGVQIRRVLLDPLRFHILNEYACSLRIFQLITPASVAEESIPEMIPHRPMREWLINVALVDAK